MTDMATIFTSPPFTLRIHPGQESTYGRQLAQRKPAIRDDLAVLLDYHEDWIETTDWTAVDGSKLMTAWQSTVAVQAHVDAFLPSAELMDRYWYYLLGLVAYARAEMEQGLWQPAEGLAPDVIPFLRAFLAQNALLSGPAVHREVRRRRQQHVGAPAADLVWHHQCEPLDCPETEAAQLTENALAALRRATVRDASRRLKLQLDPAQALAVDREAQLRSQVWKTVIERWGHLSPLEAMAAALDGNLDIAPRAIVDDLIEQMRPDMRASRREMALPAADDTLRVSLRDSTLIQRIERRSIQEQLSVTEEGWTHPWRQMTVRDATRRLEQFRRGAPEHADGLALLLSEESVRSLASARGVSPQAIRQRKARTLTALRQFFSELN
jgi:hypothetical protein